MVPLKTTFQKPLIILLLILASACTKAPHKYPAFSKEGIVNMVVEIPAGSNLKYEYMAESEDFKVDVVNGKERKISFLPFPGNYGFIPSTVMDTSRNGDGDATDILLITESVPQGMVMKAIPIGVLRLSDQDKVDDKIIAVPAKPELRIIDCTTLVCFKKNYPAALVVLEEWFGNYKGLGVTKVNGWGDEKEAVADIKTWSAH